MLEWDSKWKSTAISIYQKQCSLQEIDESNLSWRREIPPPSNIGRDSRHVPDYLNTLRPLISKCIWCVHHGDIHIIYAQVMLSVIQAAFTDAAKDTDIFHPLLNIFPHPQ